jgi:hypothetical protein
MFPTMLRFKFFSIVRYVLMTGWRGGLVGGPSRRGCREHQPLRQTQAAHQLTLMDNLHQCFVLTNPAPDPDPQQCIYQCFGS